MVRYFTSIIATMRTPLILISLLLWAWSPSTVSADEIVISGTDPGSPTKSTAELASGNAGGGERVKSKEQRAADMPNMCQVDGASCAAGDGLTQKTFLLLSVDLQLDCQRACRNPCYGDPDEFACTKICTSAVVQGGQCYLNLGTGSCTKTSSPGSTLYLPLAAGATCKDGVPTPGFPEDKNSQDYCQWVNLECIDVDTITVFEAELRTCKATCTSNVFCNSAWYDSTRWCHLRRKRCSVLSDFRASPGTTTLTVRTQAEFDKKTPCPAGSTPFVPPDPTYYDKYCAWKGLQCDLPAETDMYYGSKSQSRGFRVSTPAECIDKCTHIYSCGSAWTMTDPNYSNKISCIMQRIPPRCPSKNIVSSPDPTQWLYMRIAMNEADPDTVNDAAKLANICSKYYADTIPWKETYCGFDGNKCAGTTLTFAPFSQPVSCLTACRNRQGCSGVNLRRSGGTNPCELQSGATCTKTDTAGRTTATSAVGYTYYRLKIQGEVCPYAMSDCADQYTYVPIPLPSSSPSPKPSACAAAKGGFSADNSVCGKKSCRNPAESNTCSATPVDKCTCKDPFLYSDFAGTCVSPASCPCYHPDTPDIARPVGSEWYSGNCKQKLACVKNGSGSVPKITTVDTSDTLCGPNIMPLTGSSEGFCICPIDSILTGTACAKL